MEGKFNKKSTYFFLVWLCYFLWSSDFMVILIRSTYILIFFSVLPKCALTLAGFIISCGHRISWYARAIFRPYFMNMYVCM